MEQIIKNALLCTGCGACYNVCPSDAITMQEGYHTFLYPVIDKNKCTDCLLCVKTCPLNSYINNNIPNPIIYSAEASDQVRITSSSGGVFPIIAEHFIAKGGIVYASSLEKSLEVKFIRVSSFSDIDKCKGSKYVQSDVGKIFSSVKRDLENNLDVFFIGCPCQVAGLKKYLVKSYDNLLCVDLLCHGVPSKKIFSLYLSEKEIAYNDKVKNVLFRNKKFGWRADLITLEFNNSPDYVRSIKFNDEYETVFQKNIALRDSCENCIFSSFPRVGDLTIGDFWGINKIKEVDGKGTSIVFSNNNKGEALINKISNKFLNFEIIDIPLNKIENRVSPYYRAHKNKALFFNYIKKYSFSKAVNYTIEGKYDVAIDNFAV